MNEIYDSSRMKTEFDVSGYFKKEVRETKRLLDKISANMNDELKHDLRVSIRRIRSVLNILEDNGQKPLSDKKKKALRKIWRCLGKARDLDIVSSIADQYQVPVPDIKESRKAADRRLLKKLEKPATRRLLKSLKKISKNAFLNQINCYPAIMRLRGEVQETSINQENLHAFRITLKKVRYLLEALNFDIEDFKKYQDVLGELNDLKTFLALNDSFEEIKIIHEQKKKSALEIIQPATVLALDRLTQAAQGSFLNFNTFIFDYADVISLSQDMNEFYANADLLGMDHGKFKDQYWRFRRDYDLGQKGEEYWKLVAGRDLSEETIRQLIEHDCKSWLRINQETIEILNHLRKAKKKLALLSNLPIELVRCLRQDYSFLDVFHRIFFSSEVHKVKPDEEIYQYVLSELRVEGKNVLFFDDKKENLEGASKLGMNTYFFTPESAGKLLQEIRGN